MYTVSIRSGDQSFELLVSTEAISVGRGDPKHPTDIQLSDPYLSRHHLDILFPATDQVTIVNHGSLLRCANNTQIETDSEATFFLPLEFNVGETTVGIHPVTGEADEVYNTVIDWVNRLQAGDQEAAAEIWEAYYRRLIGLARARMDQLPKRTVDEEDIVVNAFDSFFRGVKQQRFINLADHDSLWRVLAMLTARKVAREIEHRMTQKRGEGKIRGESVFGKDDNTDLPQLGEAHWDSKQTPDFLAEMREQMEMLLDLLPDADFRTIALMRFEGASNQEIAQHLGCSERTIERKLTRIRELWGALLPDSDR
jgi:RNA polymerase sigma factor (sigma-70 family)